jgi:hypothetical protein
MDRKVAGMAATEDRTEALIVEQARLFAQALLRVTDQAPDGQVLARAEQFVLSEGRAFLRRALQASLAAQAPALEKKGHRPGPVPAAADATCAAGPRGR